MLVVDLFTYCEEKEEKEKEERRMMRGEEKEKEKEERRMRRERGEGEGGCCHPCDLFYFVVGFSRFTGLSVWFAVILLQSNRLILTA